MSVFLVISKIKARDYLFKLQPTEIKEKIQQIS